MKAVSNERRFYRVHSLSLTEELCLLFLSDDPQQATYYSMNRHIIFSETGSIIQTNDIRSTPICLPERTCLFLESMLLNPL